MHLSLRCGLCYRINQTSSVRCKISLTRWLNTGQPIQQNRSNKVTAPSPTRPKPSKTRWTADRIQNIRNWNEETSLVFGSRIDKPERNTRKQNATKSSAEVANKGSVGPIAAEVVSFDITNRSTCVKIDRYRSSRKQQRSQDDNRCDYEEVLHPGHTENNSFKLDLTDDKTMNQTPVSAYSLSGNQMCGSVANPGSKQTIAQPNNLSDELNSFIGSILHYPLFAEPHHSAFSSQNLEHSVGETSENLLENETVSNLSFSSGGNQTLDSTKLIHSVSSSDKYTAALPPLVSTHCPSVSTILSVTMPPENKFALERWEKQMIEELGKEGFAKYKTEMFQTGTRLHRSIENFLDGKSVEIDRANEGHWESIGGPLGDVSGVVCQEQGVKHSSLQYRGILDCVAMYRGVRSLVEWKTSKKARPNIRFTYDNPLQLAAYLGAYNSVLTNQQVEQCLLVIGHEDGSPADVHVINRIDCIKYWKQWLRRVHTYWVKYSST